MARKLCTTEISSRKNITLDLNNGSETSDPSLPPPPPSPELEQVFTHSVEHTEDEEDDDMARTTSARTKRVGKEVLTLTGEDQREKVQCDKCNKMVSSRCLRYYHVCREADPVAKRMSKKKRFRFRVFIHRVFTRSHNQKRRTTCNYKGDTNRRKNIQHETNI